MADRLDIIIFGATGFTGIHCIPYVHKLSKANGRNLSWGVSGRNEQKVRQSLEKVGKELEVDFSGIPVVVSDINNYESLVEMAKKTKLVVNCCGPYRFLGYDVVRACVEAGTHHVDVSGEPAFMEKVELDFGKEAKEKGIYIVSACGFDSIPTDLGIIHAQNEFEGTLNGVETILESWYEGEPIEGSSINFGTYESLVNGIHRKNVSDLKEIRKKLFKDRKLPECEPKVKFNFLPHKHKAVDGWLLPFLGSDKPVAKRTQLYLYETEKKRPVQVATYFKIESIFNVIIFLIGVTVLGILAQFELGKKILLQYPKIFTFGFIDHKSPPEQKIKNTWFSINIYGEGWKEKLPEPTDKYQTSPDRSILVKVTGQNPGYGATCLALVLSGVIILTESDKLANNGRGGVYSPGAAFGKTSIIKELNENGLKFEVVYQKDLE